MLFEPFHICSPQGRLRPPLLKLRQIESTARRLLNLSILSTLRRPEFWPRLICGSSIRSEQDFNNLTLLSASSRQTLITLWTASWCPSCRIIRPLVKEAIESGVGEEQGGVGFAEVEIDAPDNKGLGLRYFVSRKITILITYQ